MTKTLLKNTGIYFAVNLLSQGAVFLLWIIVAKVLAPWEIGMYALAIFMVDFFGAIAIFGLNNSITRFYHSDESQQSVFSNALLILIFSNAISVGVLFFSMGFIGRIIPDITQTLNNNLWLFLGLIISSSFYNFALSHYSAFKKAFGYAKINLLQTIVFLICSLVFLYLGWAISGIFYALFISYLSCMALFLFQEYKNISIKLFSIDTIKSILHYGFPMAVYSVFGVIILYISRIFLDRYTNLSILGVYSFFLVIALQVTAMWSTFNRAWTPEIFSKLKDNKEVALSQVQRMVFILSFVYLAGMACLVVLVRIGFFHFFLAPIYLSHISLFYFLLLGPLFTGIYTACYPLYYYEKKTKVILVISIILNIANIFLTFFMVKFFGQMGAAASFSLVAGISMFAYLLSFKNAMQIPYKILHWSMILFVLMSIAALLLIVTASSTLFFICMVIGLCLAYTMGDLGEIFLDGKLWKK